MTDRVTIMINPRKMLTFQAPQDPRADPITAQHGELGNKLLNLFYTAKYCFLHKEKLSLKASGISSSNINGVLDLSAITDESLSPQSIELLFDEPTAYVNTTRDVASIHATASRSRVQRLIELGFLHDLVTVNRLSPGCHYTLNGNFFHYALMPTLEELGHFGIHVRKDVIESVRHKYPTIDSEDSVTIHYRSGDFRNWTWGDQRLPQQYYVNAIRKIQARYPHKELVYHLIAQDPHELREMTKYAIGDQKVVEHSDSEGMDWISLFLSKNIICGNSTYSFTAGLYNKINVFQPEGGQQGRSIRDHSVCIPAGFQIGPATLVSY